MQELTSEQFAQEMKTFEDLCNKAQNDLQSYIFEALKAVEVTNFITIPFVFQRTKIKKQR